MRFEKVSKEQYLKDSLGDTYYSRGDEYPLSDMRGENEVSFTGSFDTLQSESMETIYDDIKLPRRATKKSAGYDFYAPYDFRLAPGESIKIATGIRVLLDDDKFLMCAPRSGLGFKARVQLDNTVGIIDADYSDSSNEGHIHVKLTNDSRTGKFIRVKKGEGMIQAIILQYFTTEDDNTTETRDGGFGSTNK